MASKSAHKLSLFALTAMVVGSMVGAGIFNLPGRFATATGPFGAIIAWAIAGTGMYMLARVFQALAEKKPDINSGVFAYAKAGFGDYMGFLSAFGYWLGSCLGNVFYWVLIGSTLGRAAMPKLRAAMHLDTVFTFADRDCVLIYPDIVNGIEAFSYRPGDKPGSVELHQGRALLRRNSARRARPQGDARGRDRWQRVRA